ncbi:MAG: LysR family transcriptional regulator [Clostridiales bacterium]|nr:LysR family transcriptional regulator [Clostridiales bacterium]
MTTEYLREFLVLARAGSFNRAAELLYTSQPVLSRHVQEMEKELGSPLFIRTPKGITLTEPGRYLARQLPKLLESCDNASAQLHQGGLPIRGRLQIACSHELSYAGHIRNLVSRFMRRYRDLDVSLEVLSGAMPLSVLRAYDVLLSPCRYAELPDGTRQTLLAQHNVYVYVYPGHRLMARQSIRLEELAGETVLVPYAAEAFGPYARNWQLAERQTRGTASCQRVTNLATALFMLSADTGCIMLAPRYVRNLLPAEIATSSIVIPVSDSECCFEEYIYTTTYESNGAARLFHEELLAACLPASGNT